MKVDKYVANLRVLPIQPKKKYECINIRSLYYRRIGIKNICAGGE